MRGMLEKTQACDKYSKDCSLGICFAHAYCATPLRRSTIAKLIESSQRACSGRYQRFDRLPQDISRAHFELLAVHRTASQRDLDAFATDVIGHSNDIFHLGQRLSALRVVVRQQHLTCFRLPLETFRKADQSSQTGKRVLSSVRDGGCS